MPNNTLKRSACEGKIKLKINKQTKPSFKLASVVFPESHGVASFMVFTFHPAMFFQEDITNSLISKQTRYIFIHIIDAFPEESQCSIV